MPGFSLLTFRVGSLDTKENRVSNYVKAIAAVVGAVAVAFVQVFGPDGGVVTEVATIVVAVLTALGVYQAPNRP